MYLYYFSASIFCDYGIGMTINTLIILLLIFVICLAMVQTITYEGYTDTATKHAKYIEQLDFRDVQYHEDPESLKEETFIKVKNKWGRLIDMPWSTAVTTTPFYNPPASFKFGPASYVPDYTESILLRRAMRSV